MTGVSSLELNPHGVEAAKKGRLWPRGPGRPEGFALAVAAPRRPPGSRPRASVCC